MANTGFHCENKTEPTGGLGVKTPSQVRESGLLIRPGEVPDIEKYGIRTKRLISPALGSALTGCQVLYLQPGDTYPVHAHPVSEDVVIVFKGCGEVFLGECWYEVAEGDVIYAPENVKHGVRSPADSTGLFICYNWQVPYLDEFDNTPGLEDELFGGQAGRVIARDERGRFDARVPETGYIEHIDRGALFTEYGAPMRFIVWPGMGARKVSLHRAQHPPGQEFKVHIHPASEDTILAFRGSGQGFLVDRWYDMAEGDVLHAPRGVKHGTRNPAGNRDEFICTGAAAPPQMDLYRLAGYL